MSVVRSPVSTEFLRGWCEFKNIKYELLRKWRFAGEVGFLKSRMAIPYQIKIILNQCPDSKNVLQGILQVQKQGQSSDTSPDHSPSH